ncbi:MAG: hypothetical protein LBS82_06060, partial [Spirochaetaceae bacterium]|nr:hypothetical protein [Spirochaetaceae bacterium]
MELFTFGNLLTIIILAVILALYRLLDKRNRNWDAANKYGKQLKDALKEELGEYIDKKKADIYNYGAILDAEKFSARAVLANIEEKEGELSKQSERYDKISEKLNAYDASLGELLRMTERVETNLFRIQQESGFVENVAVQIDDAKENLAALSAKIVAMSGKIEGDVEHSIKDTLVKIDGILEGARDKAQERVRLWLHKLESELCEGFRSETDNRIKALKQDLEEQIADMAGDVSRKEAQNKNIAELIAQAEQLDAEFHLRLEDSADSVKNEIGRFEAEIAGSRAKIAEDCNAALQGITTNIAEIESAIEKIKEETQEKTGENLKLFEDEFMATLEKRRESIGVQLNAWRDEMNGKLNGIGENQEAELRKLEAGFAENLRRHITELDDKFRVELEHLSGTAEAFETSIGTQLKITEENIASSKEQIQNEFNELRESSLESLGTEIARISVESADKIKKFIRDFEKEHGAIKEHIIEKNEEIERLLLKSRGNIEESSGNVAALKASIDEINAGMEKQRSAILLDTEEKIKKLELMLQAAEGKVQEFLSQTKLVDKTIEMKTALQHQIEDIQSDLGRLELQKGDIANIERQLSGVKRLEDEV